MVSEDEWSQLQQMFQVDKEIRVERQRDSSELFTSEPKVCHDCVARRHQQELEERLVYSNEPIYVRRLMGSEKPEDLVDPEDPDFLEHQRLLNDTEAMDGPWEDPDANEPSPTKRARTESASTALPQMNHGRTVMETSVRRSNRRQKVRGEKEFFVSSDMLLRDLKVKVRMLCGLSEPPSGAARAVGGGNFGIPRSIICVLPIMMTHRRYFYIWWDEYLVVVGGQT